jgi:hypothetical protein
MNATDDYGALADIPLYITSTGLVKAFCTAGFLSCSGYFEMGKDCADPEIMDNNVDFRDFCHSLAM